MTDTENDDMMTDNQIQQDTRQSASDVLGRAIFAGMLIYAGLVFLADQLGLLPDIPDVNNWHWIMLGAGGLILLDVVLRVIWPNVHGPGIGRIIVGLILLGVGMSNIFGISIGIAWWPVILIVIGLSILTRNL